MRRPPGINAAEPVVFGRLPPPLLKYHGTTCNAASGNLIGSNLGLFWGHRTQPHAVHLVTVPTCNRRHFDRTEISEITAQPFGILTVPINPNVYKRSSRCVGARLAA